MIVVAGTITMDSSKRDAFTAGLDEMQGPSRAEPGCLEYQYWLSGSRDDVVFIFEKWESDEALELHLHAPHMELFRPIMRSAGITRFEVTKYQVSHEQALR